MSPRFHTHGLLEAGGGFVTKTVLGCARRKRVAIFVVGVAVVVSSVLAVVVVSAGVSAATENPARADSATGTSVTLSERSAARTAAGAVAQQTGPGANTTTTNNTSARRPTHPDRSSGAGERGPGSGSSVEIPIDPNATWGEIKRQQNQSGQLNRTANTTTAAGQASPPPGTAPGTGGVNGTQTGPGAGPGNGSGGGASPGIGTTGATGPSGANGTTTPECVPGAGASGAGDAGVGDLCETNRRTGNEGGLLQGAVDAMFELLGRIGDFFITGVQQLVTTVTSGLARLLSMTPYPRESTGRFFQNPTAMQYPQIYELWQTTGATLARVAWVLSAGLLVALGRFGAGLIPWAREKKLWWGLLLTLFFVTRAGWTLVNIPPAVADIIAQTFTLPIQQSPDAFDGLLILVMLLAAIFESLAMVLLVFLAAIRVETIMWATPFIPGLVILAAGCPWKFGQFVGKASVQLWLILIVSGLPSALILSAAFNSGVPATFVGSPIESLLAIGFKVGGVIAALLIPFVLWKTMNSLFRVAGLPGMASSEKIREKHQQYRERASELRQGGGTTIMAGREAKRGVRGQQPIQGDRWHGTTSRSYDIGRGARHPKRTTRRKASAVKQGVSSKVSPVARRVANMKQRAQNLR